MKKRKNKVKNKLAVAVVLSCMTLSPLAYGAEIIPDDPTIKIIKNDDKTTTTTGEVILINNGDSYKINGDTYFKANNTDVGTGIHTGAIIDSATLVSGDNWKNIYDEIYGNAYNSYSAADSAYNTALNNYDQANSAYDSAVNSYTPAIGSAEEVNWNSFQNAYTEYQNSQTPENKAIMDSCYSEWEGTASGEAAGVVKVKWEDKVEAEDNKNSTEADKNSTEAIFNNLFESDGSSKAENKLKLTKSEVEILSGSSESTSQSASYQKTTIFYNDLVTQSTQTLKVRDNIYVSEGSPSLPNSDITQQYSLENGNQYSATQLVTVKSSELNIDRAEESTGVVDLNVIMKKESGVFVADTGSTINFNKDFKYSTGDNSHVGTTIKDTSGGNIILGDITWGGQITAPWGIVSVNNNTDANTYNDALIKYIQTDPTVRLMTSVEVQKFYDKWINKIYTIEKTDTITYTYEWDEDKLDVPNAIKRPDVGLESPSNNYLVGLIGGGNVVNVVEGVTVDPTSSAGSIIKTINIGTDKDVININGTLGNVYSPSAAIVGNNLDIKVASTGKVLNTINIEDSSLVNDGEVRTVKITGSSIFDNNNKVNGNVTTGVGSTFNNRDKAVVTGDIKLEGTESNHAILVNDGIIEGSIIYTSYSDITNGVNSILIGNLNSTKEVEVKSDPANPFTVKTFLGGINHTTNSTAGHIFVGYDRYEYDPNQPISANNPKMKQANINDAGLIEEYYGEYICQSSTFSLLGTGQINIAGTQSKVTGIFLDGGTYKDEKGAVINVSEGKTADNEFNGNVGLEITGRVTQEKLDANEGKVPVTEVNAAINVYGAGDHGIQVEQKGNAQLNSDLNVLNTPTVKDGKVTDTAVGVYVEGKDSIFTLNGAKINLGGDDVKADRAIGIQVRDGATVIFKDDTLGNKAGIVFGNKDTLSDDKNASVGQIGVLISGISTSETNFIYNSSAELALEGAKDAVLFRVERGAAFKTGTQFSDNIISSKEGDNSALLVVTSGSVLKDDNGDDVIDKHAKANIENVTLSVNGKNSTGIRVEGGAIVDLKNTVNITLSGTGNTIAKIDGNYYDILGNKDDTHKGNSTVNSSMNIVSTNYTGDVTGSVGYHVLNGGTLNHDGEIDFKSNDSGLVGVWIQDGGTLNTGATSKIEALGTAIKIQGDDAVANIANKDGSIVYANGTAALSNAAAYYLLEGGKISLTGDGINVATTKAEGTAYGILVDAASSKSTISLSKTFIDMTNGTGSGIENKGNITNITLNNARIDVNNGAGIHSAVGFIPLSGTTSGVINVKGSGTGILFEDMTTAGKASTNEITFTKAKDLVVNVETGNGEGIIANTTKDVTTSGSVNVLSATGGTALQVMEVVDGVTSASKTVTQQGNLHSTSSTSAIVEVSDNVTNFNNSGDVLFGTFGAQQTTGNYAFTAGTNVDNTAFEKSKGTNITFNNESGGKINGVVKLTVTNGTTGNIANLKAGSAGEKFLGGDGNDTFNVTTIQGADNDDDKTNHQFTQLDGGSGSDVVNFQGGSKYTITNVDTVKNIEQMNIKDSSYITLDKVLPNGTNSFDIAKDAMTTATLQYNINTATDFAKQVTNSGVFYINGEGDLPQKFNFATNQSNFTGTFKINNVNYDLSNNSTFNQKSLEQANLLTIDKSLVTVGTGQQDVGNVTFKGSTIADASTFVFGGVNFQKAMEDDETIDVADNYIKTDTLTTGNVKIQADIADTTYNEYDPIDPKLKPIVELDDANVGVQIIQAKTVTTTAGTTMILVDADGKEVTGDIVSPIIQNDARVANAIYGPGLAVVTDQDEYVNGLYITSGLAEIELLEKEKDNSNALRLDASNAPNKGTTEAQEKARTLTVKLTNGKNADGSIKETGDVVIIGTEEVILSNTNNDYRGKTILETGAKLKTGQSGSFGDTAELVLGKNSNVNLNGKEEKVGAFNTSEGSKLQFNNGTLIIDETNNWDEVTKSVISSDNTLIGTKDAKLIAKTGAQVEVQGSNSDFAGAIDIIGDAPAKTDYTHVTIFEGNSLGKGEITLTGKGELELQLKNDGTVSNTFAAGDATAVVSKTETKTATFAKDTAEYLATTNIEAGTIIFDGGDVKSNAINVKSAGTMKTSATSATTVAGDVNNLGTTIALKEAIFSKTFTNSGNFYVGNDIGATTSNSEFVTIAGNYNGKVGSNLFFRGDLEADDSAINKLVVNDTTGASQVYIANSNGAGAYTEKGILLIDVTDKEKSDAVFTADRVIVGAYSYGLQKGDRTGANMEDWFLLSQLSQEPISYFTNYSMMSDVADLRLQDRLGSKEFGDYLTSEKGEEATDDNIWARMVYRKSNFKDELKMNKINTNSTYMQVGYDLANWRGENNENRQLFGVMFGYMNGGHSVKGINNASTSGDNDIYSLGLYGTWLENKAGDSQDYVDTWVQYLWSRNEMKGQYIDEKYNSGGWAASIELGRTKKIDESGERQYFIEPKAQLTWNNFSQDSVDWQMNGGSINRFEQKTSNQLTSRLGLRFVSRQNDPEVKYKKDNSFLELNWLHNFKEYEFKLGGNDLKMGQSNVFEVKAGYEKQFNEKYSLWLNGFIQLGSNEYRSFGTQLGVKYTF